MAHNTPRPSIRTPYPYPYPSAFQHESGPHANHITVPVYVHLLHECQAVEHADLGSSLQFLDDYAKSNLLPTTSYVRYHPYPHRHVVINISM
jgi:hypothetical protein